MARAEGCVVFILRGASESPGKAEELLSQIKGDRLPNITLLDCEVRPRVRCHNSLPSRKSPGANPVDRRGVARRAPLFGKEHIMKDSTEGIFDPSNLCQIGIIVKNIDETLKYYRETFGMGPFDVRYVDYPLPAISAKQAGYRGKRAFFHLGPIEIELIELVDGKTIHEAFLRERGKDFIILVLR